MKCLIPQNTGFCEGVSVAVKTAYDNANKSTYMYGQVVHNPIVISDLLDKGMKVIDSIDDIPTTFKGSILIRAHGVAEKVIAELNTRGINIIDNTCPKVKKVHEIVKAASIKGLDVIIVGNPSHPEVIGTMGWIYTKVVVIQNIEEAEKIIPNTHFSEKGVCMVAQTTYNRKNYENICRYCKSQNSNIICNLTICDSTIHRQDEAKRLSHLADGVILVGGKNSSNVAKLYEIILESCNNVQFIESVNELDFSAISNSELLVIFGGASTPQSAIMSVIERIKLYCIANKIELKITNNEKELNEK